MTQNLAEIRIELLQQHDDLRAEMQVTRRAALRCRRGDHWQAALQRSMSRLEYGLRAHNAWEDELLGDIIPTIDAWGPCRAEVMTEAHLAETDALHVALVRALGDPTEAGVIALAVLTRVTECMTREEEDVLCVEVLDEDHGWRDSFGG